MARNPSDTPGAAAFGQLVSECMQQRDANGDKVWANANQIQDAFGVTPGGRTWGEISDSGKAYMKDAPKAP